MSDAAYAQSHATLHRRAVRPLAALATLLRDDLPEVVAWLRVPIAPELIALFASPQLIATVERGGLWTEGLLNVVPSSVLSLKVLT